MFKSYKRKHYQLGVCNHPMARRRRQPHYIVNLGLGTLVLAVLAATGIRFMDFTSAATINPYGYADYCALENNTTIIYGWAADPNATSLTQPLATINAGGQAVTVVTGQSGYRDAAINAWIDQHRAGDPKPGTYGFRAPLAGLYKGTRNVITGSVINEGPGSSVILNINTSGPTDGVTGRPYFAGNIIPDACLATRPASPTPPATPPAAPSPTTPRPNPSSPGPTPVPVTPQPAGSLSSATDAEITAGSLAVSVKVPAGGATNVRLLYGTNPLAPGNATADIPVVDGVATIPISALEARTTYSYQIVRFDAAGRTATSPVGTFKTRGFTLTVRFTDNKKAGQKGIAASLSVQPGTRKTTDDKGVVSFQDVPSGSHTIDFEYTGRTYQELVTTTAAKVKAETAAQAKVLTIEHAINVDALPKTSQKREAAPKQDSAALPAILALAGAALLAAIAFAVRRRRHKRYDYPVGGAPAPLAAYTPPSAPATSKEEPIDINQYPIITRPNGAEHMGESLKDMVIRSMAEEAKRRQEGPKE